MKKVFLVTMVAVLPTIGHKIQLMLKDADQSETDLSPGEKMRANLEKYKDKLPPDLAAFLGPMSEVMLPPGPTTVLILSGDEYKKLGMPSVGKTIEFDIEVRTE